MNKRFYGTGVALVTPFNEDFSIDYYSLEKLLKYVSEGGVDYLVILGTTGESATLSDSEKNDILAFVKINNAKKLPIVLGYGGNDTSKLVEGTKKIDWSGIDAVLSVSPYYNKPSQEGLINHYTALADTCPVPIILYNIPGRTGSNMLAETTIRLSAHDNIIGVKEASGDLAQCIEISKEKPESFLLIGGDDILTLPMISIGGVGAISAISNAFPDVTSKMTNYALNSDYTKANAYLHQFCSLNKLFFEEGNPVGVKAMLSIKNICKPYVRLPLTKASDALTNKLAASLK